MSDYTEHARHELELIGEDEDTIKIYLDLIEKFHEINYSDGPLRVAATILTELLYQRNLAPLTDDPDEWIKYDESVLSESGEIWRNKRNNQAFTEDRGMTYYLAGAKGEIFSTEHKDIKEKS